MVDEALTRSLMQLFQAGLFDRPEKTEWFKIGLDDVNSTATQEASFEIGLQSMVLLKLTESFGELP